MEHDIHHIASAETLDGGVVITFDDGNSALYSSELLYSMLSQAQALIEPEDE